MIFWNDLIFDLDHSLKNDLLLVKIKITQLILIFDLDHFTSDLAHLWCVKTAALLLRGRASFPTPLGRLYAGNSKQLFINLHNWVGVCHNRPLLDVFLHALLPHRTSIGKPAFRVNRIKSHQNANLIPEIQMRKSVRSSLQVKGVPVGLGQNHITWSWWIGLYKVDGVYVAQETERN